MTPTVSPRIGLLVDTLDETDINTNMTNWDRVDYATGFTHTKKTTTVPVAKQFDGQMVAQTDTSLTWLVTPGNTKRFMNYPYLIKLKADHGNGFPNGVTNTNAWHTVQSGGANYATSDLTSAGAWIVPTKGLWALEWVARWAINGAGFRTHGIEVNGSRQLAWEDVENGTDNNFPTVNMGKELVWLNEGDSLKPYYYQNSGGVLGCISFFKARLIRPLI